MTQEEYELISEALYRYKRYLQNALLRNKSITDKFYLRWKLQEKISPLLEKFDNHSLEHAKLLVEVQNLKDKLEDSKEQAAQDATRIKQLESQVKALTEQVQREEVFLERTAEILDAWNKKIGQE